MRSCPPTKSASGPSGRSCHAESAPHATQNSAPHVPSIWLAQWTFALPLLDCVVVVRAESHSISISSSLPAVTNCDSNFRLAISSNTSWYHPKCFTRTSGSLKCLPASCALKEQDCTTRRHCLSLQRRRNVSDARSPGGRFAYFREGGARAHLVGFLTSAKSLESKHHRKRTGRIPQQTHLKDRPHHWLLPAGRTRWVLVFRLLCAQLDRESEVLHTLLNHGLERLVILPHKVVHLAECYALRHADEQRRSFGAQVEIAPAPPPPRSRSQT